MSTEIVQKDAEDDVEDAVTQCDFIYCSTVIIHITYITLK